MLVHGIPCFGENSIRAIKGEYKLEMPDETIVAQNEDSSLLIGTWLTSEFIYISPELWDARPSMQNLRAMEIRNDQGLYVILGFPNTVTDQEKWTILFHVPQEVIDAEINNNMINRMIQNWTSRLSYYISISQNEAQISLPAVIAF
jgi:hypothetical protein